MMSNTIEQSLNGMGCDCLKNLNPPVENMGSIQTAISKVPKEALIAGGVLLLGGLVFFLSQDDKTKPASKTLSGTKKTAKKTKKSTTSKKSGKSGAAKQKLIEIK